MSYKFSSDIQMRSGRIDLGPAQICKERLRCFLRPSALEAGAFSPIVSGWSFSDLPPWDVEAASASEYLTGSALLADGALLPPAAVLVSGIAAALCGTAERFAMLAG